VLKPAINEINVSSVLWASNPDTVFVGINTLHFAVFGAVETLNQGNCMKCDLISVMVKSIMFQHVM
jgi:hypothetical protein